MQTDDLQRELVAIQNDILDAEPVEALAKLQRLIESPSEPAGPGIVARPEH